MSTITVVFDIDAETDRDAEKLLDHWLRDAEDDERLIGYEVTRHYAASSNDAAL
jgi:hypothetical protein